MRKNNVFAEPDPDDLSGREILQEHEAVLFTGMCGKTLRKLRQRKQIPFAQAGRRILYSKAALIRWIEGGGSQSQE